jgi:hypothetical protein
MPQSARTVLLSRAAMSNSPRVRSEPVTMLPSVAPVQPEVLGIVIRSGAPAPKPVRFWAYLLAADDEDTMDQHWHQRVPAEHAA